MSIKAIIFLAIWALAALGISEPLNLENRAVALRAVADALDIRGVDEADLLDKFRMLLARDTTSVVSASDCVPLPTSASGGGLTSSSLLTPTIPGSSSISSEVSSILSGIPTGETSAASSATAASQPQSTGKSGSPAPPAATSAGPTKTSKSSPAPSSGKPASSAVSGTSGVSPTAASTTEGSTPSSASTSTTAPKANNAPFNEGLGTAFVAMAVALGMLVAM